MRITGLVATAMLAPGSLLSRKSRTKPNILFLLVDDQRNDTLGCAGHPIIKTPVIAVLPENGPIMSNPSGCR